MQLENIKEVLEQEGMYKLTRMNLPENCLTIFTFSYIFHVIVNYNSEDLIQIYSV